MVTNLNCFAQEVYEKANAAAEAIEDVTEGETELHGNVNIVVQTVTEVITTAGNVMGKVYGIYKNILAATETVSDVISTYHEIMDAMNDINDIVEMYSKYGVKFRFNSLYDFDKYLNPRQQAEYMREMLAILDQAVTCFDWMKICVGRGGGQYTDSKGNDLTKSSYGSGVLGGSKEVEHNGAKLKLNDYWRLRIIRQMTSEIRELKMKMFRLIYRTTCLVQVNYANQKYIAEYNSIFDVSKYHYSSIGLFGLGEADKNASKYEKTYTKEDYVKILESASQHDLDKGSLLCVPRAELNKFVIH